MVLDRRVKYLLRGLINRSQIVKKCGSYDKMISSIFTERRKWPKTFPDQPQKNCLDHFKFFDINTLVN